MAIFCYFFNRFGARYVDIQPSTNLLFDARETERIAEERARRSQAASNRHNCILFYSAAYGTGPPTDDTHTATTGTTVSRRLFYFHFFLCVSTLRSSHKRQSTTKQPPCHLRVHNKQQKGRNKNFHSKRVYPAK